jgi:hypothetical protein
MLKARFAKGLQTNIYFVNVKGDGKYDCIFPTIVGTPAARFAKAFAN